MIPVVFDLECFYDPRNVRGDVKVDGSPDPYTIKAKTTESYVRDKRWNIHGASIKWSESTSATWYDPRELDYVLKQQNWDDIFLISHHANFDHLALSHHYGIVPKMSGCSMSMARLMLGTHIGVSLDSVRAQFGFPAKSTPYGLMEGRYWKDMDAYTREQVANGANDEVESIWQLFGILMQRGFPVEELDVVDTTIKMFTIPELKGDSAVFAKVWQDETVRKQEALQNLGVTAKDLGSDEKFVSLLLARGVEPETKVTDKGNTKYAFAKTDPFMEELQQHEDEQVRALAEARLGTKSTLLQTRAATLGWMASRGPLCVYLRYCGAHTSRWSGGDDTNFQNWTNGSEINSAVVAPDGYLIAEPDASQIECVAHGQIVLTDNGPKPIQNVQLSDRVWDGIEWVTHEGVVYKGTKPVISYQGLTCTPDHVVYVRGDHGEEKMEMRSAAASSRDLVTADAPASIRKAPLPESFVRRLQNLRRPWNKIQIQVGARSSYLGGRKFAPSGLRRRGNRPQEQRRTLRTWKFAAIISAGKCQQSIYNFLGTYQAWAACDAGFQTHVPRMRLWPGPDQKARRAWHDWRSNNGPVQKRSVEHDGCGGQEETRPIQQARVYDIVNAGPRHRFAVAGVIVSNCRLLNFCAGQEDKIEEFRSGADPYIGVASKFYGFPVNKKDHPDERQLGKIVELQAGYGSGGNKIRSTIRVKSGGKIILNPSEGVQARDAYRDTHPRVVAYWRQAENFLACMGRLQSGDWEPFKIRCDATARTRRVVLPNGIQLIYDTLEYFSDLESGDQYWRLKTRKGWTKIYGAKFVENLIQALARVVVSQAMLRLKKFGYRCKNTKHDSLWLLIPDDGDLDRHKEVILQEMSRPPIWMPDVPLAAEFKGIGNRMTW